MITVESQLWRTNYQGDLLEDISEYLIEASVNMDTENDQTWSLNAVLKYDGWKKLTPYLDWIVPFLKVTYPDGYVSEGPLGLYLVLDSPEEHTETQGRVRVTAMDPLWLLARQGFTSKVEARKGIGMDRIVRMILDGAVLTERQGIHRRYIIPNTDKTLRRDREWPRDTNRLEVVNQILNGMACYPLWSTKHGIMLTKRRGESRLKNRHPVRTFSANLPKDYLNYREIPWGGFESNIVNIVNTSPRGDDFINEILMVNDDPDLPRIYVRGQIKNPSNPRSALQEQGRKHSRKHKLPHVPDHATAREVARSLLEELSTRNRTIQIEVHPDPETEFSRETVMVLIQNIHGDWIARGQYSVHHVEYGFTPNSAMMRMNLGRVDDASEVLFQEA